MEPINDPTSSSTISSCPISNSLPENESIIADSKPPWLRKVYKWDTGIVQRCNSKIVGKDFSIFIRIYSRVFSPLDNLFTFLILLPIAIITHDYHVLASYLGALSLGTVIFFGLKNTICRHRPYLKAQNIQSLDKHTSQYCFPSGHAFFTMLIGTFLCIELSWPVWAYLIMFLIVGLTGLSRIFMGVHYPTDVIFGFIFALLSNWLYFILIKTYYITIFYAVF